MELRSSGEATSCATTHEFPSIYGTRSSITTFTRTLHWSPFYLSTIHLNVIHPPTSWSSCGLFLSGFYTDNMYAFLFSPIRATSPSHYHDLIILNVLGKKYILRSYSLCSFLHPSVISSFFAWSILTPHCSQTPTVYVPPLMSGTKFRTHSSWYLVRLRQ
jgi:hypothetical protein